MLKLKKYYFQAKFKKTFKGKVGLTPGHKEILGLKNALIFEKCLGIANSSLYMVTNHIAIDPAIVQALRIILPLILGIAQALRI